MTKHDFLAALSRALYDLPVEEREESLAYYGEMIDERMESGLGEEEATSALGTPEEVAREIRLQMPLPALVRAKWRRGRAWRMWELILLIAGAPLWLSLLLAVASAVLSVYVSLWACFVAAWAVAVSVLGVAAGALVRFGASFADASVRSVFYLGLALFGAGLGILLWTGCAKLNGVFVQISARFMRYLKNKIIGKEKGA